MNAISTPTGLKLIFEDPVFGNKILIAQKEFLVHGPGDIGQYPHRIHKHLSTT